MRNLFNTVNWYKFEVNGQRMTIIATSMIGAMSIIENEIGDGVKYTYIGIVE